MDRARQIEKLTAELKSADVSRRADAAQELGELGGLPESTIVELANAAIDGDIGMRMRAGKTLARLGKGAEPGVKVLTDAIASPDPDMRKHSAMAIGEIGAAARFALPHLIALESRVPDDVRSIVASSLKRIAPHGVDVLVEWLKSDEQPRRLDAMQIIELAGRGVTKTAPMLVPLLRDEQEHIRVAAARALGSAGTGDSSVVTALTAALDDSDTDVRVAALAALAKVIEDPGTTLSLLLFWVEADDAAIRDTAINLLEPALHEVASRRFENEKLEAALTRLRSAAASVDPGTAERILALVAYVNRLLGPGAASDGTLALRIESPEEGDGDTDLSLDSIEGDAFSEDLDDLEDLGDPGVDELPAPSPRRQVQALNQRVVDAARERGVTAPGARYHADASPTAEASMVNFTVYSPTEAPPDCWNDLLAYVHLPKVASTVESDSRRHMEARRPVRRKVRQSTSKIAAGAAITVVPELPGCTFNPPTHQFLWLEEWHRAHFRFRASVADVQGGLDRATNGRIAFYGESILLGEVPLSVYLTRDVDSDQASATHRPVTADPYDAVFVSYSHDDFEVVNSVSQAAQVLGIGFLRDQDVLRSGEDWNARLLEMIPKADIFQLFWSTNAGRSKYVEQEWRRALTLDRERFIRPLYWTKPMIAPPSELAHLHFAYYPFE